jgi:hypothetical protein
VDGWVDGWINAKGVLKLQKIKKIKNLANFFSTASLKGIFNFSIFCRNIILKNCRNLQKKMLPGNRNIFWIFVGLSTCFELVSKKVEFEN